MSADLAGVAPAFKPAHTLEPGVAPEPALSTLPVAASGDGSPAAVSDISEISSERGFRRWLRPAAIVVLAALFATELVLGWPALSGALRQLQAPRPGWLAAATVAELGVMSAYARMQRRLLRSAGVRATILQHIGLAYAAHSLSATLPGGPAFSTRFNYQQMRRFGATPAVASWCIALSGILSATALAVVTVAGALATGGVADWRHLAGLAVAGAVIVLGVRRITRHPGTVDTVARAVLAPINRLRHRPPDHGQDRIRGFVDQLRAARLAPGHAAAAAAYAIANWLLDAVCLWMCCRAVGGDSITLGQVLLAFCAAMAAGTITLIPGGLGLIDSALILGLLAGGIPTTTAVGAVVLYRIISFGFIIGIGWISWLVIRRRTA